jgi:hypothetical protein
MGTVFVHPSMENVMQIIFRITCPRTEGDTETFIQKVEQQSNDKQTIALIAKNLLAVEDGDEQAYQPVQTQQPYMAYVVDSKPTSCLLGFLSTSSRMPVMYDFALLFFVPNEDVNEEPDIGMATNYLTGIATAFETYIRPRVSVHWS